MKRKIFFEVNGFNENLTLYEDLDLALKLNARGEIIFGDNIIMLTSMRRYEKTGYIKWFWKYMIAYIKYLAGRQPISNYPKIR